MSRALDLSLRDAASSTFEDVAFLLAVPLSAKDHATATVDAAVSIAFRGPMVGSLWLGIGGGVLPEIAANMLGEEMAPSEREQMDALGELANMICGSLLPQLAPGEEFAQEPPCMERATALEGAPVVPAAAAWIGLGQGIASVRLYLVSGAGGERE